LTTIENEKHKEKFLVIQEKGIWMDSLDVVDTMTPSIRQNNKEDEAEPILI
jgi:hypothetical protein